MDNDRYDYDDDTMIQGGNLDDTLDLEDTFTGEETISPWREYGNRWKKEQEDSAEEDKSEEPVIEPARPEPQTNEIESFDSKETAPTAPKKPRKTVFIIAGVAVALMIALIAILIPTMKERNRVKRYNQGAELLEKGDYAGAYRIFSDMGDYEDAPVIAMYAQRGKEYNEAVELMEKGQYEKAAAKFEELSGFKDAEAMAEQCRKEIVYQEGITLFDVEDYDGAMQVMQTLTGYRDADLYIRRCVEEKARGAYEAAITAGDYQRALELLDAGEGNWPNVDELRTACQNQLVYREAESAKASGKNYTAWKKYKSLGDFQDAKEKAKSCVEKKPYTGETYRSSRYKGKAALLTFKPPKDGDHYYVKIYAVNSRGKEVLASCLFIRSGKNLSIKLPAGTYEVKMAYSDGSWYGEKEMFGENGVYQRLLFSGNSESIKLKKNAKLTIDIDAGKGYKSLRDETMGTF